MADGEGILGQQLAIATEIPYKNIQSNQTSLERGLNAWSTATAIKLKRQELEGRMQALVAKNAELESRDRYKQEDFNRTLALKEMQIHDSEGRSAFMDKVNASKLWLSERARDTADRRLDYTIDKHQDAMDATAGLFQIEGQLEKEGLESGTRAWKIRYDQLAQEFVGKLPASTFNNVNNKILENQNLAINRALKNNKLRQETFRQKVGAELYNNPQIQGLDPVVDPDKQPSVTTPSGHLWWYKDIEDPTKKKIFVTDPTTGKSKQVNTVATKQLQELHEEWKQLDDESKSLAIPNKTYSTDPDIQDGRDAIAAAKAKGQDITAQVRDRIKKMGKDPDEL